VHAHAGERLSWLHIEDAVPRVTATATDCLKSAADS
jgi:hypothetical protein